MGARRSNHAPIAMTILGRIRAIMGSRTRTTSEPKPAHLGLLGRARSRVRDIFLYLAHANMFGIENLAQTADDSAQMIGQARIWGLQPADQEMQLLLLIHDTSYLGWIGQCCCCRDEHMPSGTPRVCSTIQVSRLPISISLVGRQDSGCQVTSVLRTYDLIRSQTRARARAMKTGPH